MPEFLTLNKGEWTECYAFMKIVDEGFLNGSDENLNPITGEKRAVVYVTYDQTQSASKLFYRKEGDRIIVSIDELPEHIVTDVTTFRRNRNILFSKIVSGNGSSFSITELSDYLSKIGNPKIKSPSSVKRDLTISIQDPLTGTNPEYGFSVKSNLGQNSTLLNASVTGTRFRYRVECNPDKYSKLKGKELLKKLNSDGVAIKFEKMQCSQFKQNMEIIDTNLHIFLAEMLLDYYSTAGTNVTSLLSKLITRNPANYENTDAYRIKISKFLEAIALGMVPETYWNGEYDADGGMLIVKKNGEIAAFYLLSSTVRQMFGKYLLARCYFDTPSMTRHRFGSLFSENGSTFLDLNIQIRVKN